jgi:hypothetical protein
MSARRSHSKHNHKPAIWIILVILVLSIASSQKNDPYRVVRQDCITPGERIEYRVHYGLINAGEAVMKTDDGIHRINNRACYKIDVFGRTKGIFDMLTTVRDNWGATWILQQWYLNGSTNRSKKGNT